MVPVLTAFLQRLDGVRPVGHCRRNGRAMMPAFLLTGSIAWSEVERAPRGLQHLSLPVHGTNAAASTGSSPSSPQLRCSPLTPGSVRLRWYSSWSSPLPCVGSVGYVSLGCWVWWRRCGG